MTNNEMLQILKDRETELEHEVNHYRVMKSFEGDEKQRLRFSLLYAENRSALKALQNIISEVDQLDNVVKKIQKAVDEEDPEIIALLIEYSNLKKKMTE
ncbi:hypothetical protein [Clostridium beijerinckii]|uniref:hypothetical protein n=1 Tax=Clostridium beijerinckii TaxID=1520 RepID=UPI0004790158|nr:hypothetical protein [Clostridium beijerinckii]